MPSNKVMTDGHHIARKMYPGPLVCEWPGCNLRAERHHKDRNPMNNRRSNVEFLCKKHHVMREQRFTSPEAIAKKSSALRGRTLSLKHRTNIGSGLRGRAKSESHRQRLSESLRGKFAGVPKPPRTAAHCLKLSMAKKGKTYGPLSKERRERISAALAASWARRKREGEWGQ
jgi:hypothetical protein